MAEGEGEEGLGTTCPQAERREARNERWAGGGLRLGGPWADRSQQGEGAVGMGDVHKLCEG